jgi:glycosyltransferase involved in cell wall biosynthesis
MKILTIANAVPRKRLDLCALACARMEETELFDNLTWRVIGRGPLLDDVKKIAPASMEFLDRVDSLTEHYHWSDLFVLPSADEGLGMVYVESIMCGRPVICRANDGGQDVINKTGGGLAIEIPNNDLQAVANICQAALEIDRNRGKYMAPEICEKARMMVDFNSLRAQWDVLIKECQSRK